MRFSDKSVLDKPGVTVFRFSSRSYLHELHKRLEFARRQIQLYTEL